MKKFTRFVVVAVLGLAIGTAFVQFRREANRAVSTETPTAPLSAVQAAKAPDVAPFAPPPMSRAGERRFAATVREAFPNLEQPVKNWRTFKPERLTVAPYPDTPLEFKQVSVREENGRTIWTGRNALTGAFMVLVSTERDASAVLEIPTADNFELTVTGDSVAVAQTSAAGGCATDRLPLRTKAADADTGAVADPNLPAEATVVPKADSPYTYVDVVFFYDQATLSYNSGNVTSMVNAVMARIESANMALANSAIANLRWRYAAMYPIPAYTAPTDIVADLDRISSITQSVQAVPDNTQRQFIVDKLAAHGADQALLYITGTRPSSGTTVGIAWSPSTMAQNISSGAARAVVMWRRNSDGYLSGYGTMAHELAHNFACQHDRETEGATDNDGEYWYGHTLTYSGSQYGTIMSYLGTRIPYFSNPNVNYNGVPTGVATTQPKAAYNALVLTNKTGWMSGLRALLPPVITTQPVSTTFNVGGSLAFSSEAQGAVTGYQWQKDGAAISGASSVSYSVSSAASTDAGFYNLIVMNPVGATISNSVTATASSSSSSSSGSGGGSAPVITVNPVSFSSPTEGVSYTLSLAATGTDLRYQWYFRSQPILGANGTSYIISSLGSTTSGTYFAVVSNSLGVAASSYADVTFTGTSSSSSSSSSGGGSSSGPAPAPNPTGSSGSGGAMPGWVLVAMAFAAGVRFLNRKR